MHVKRVKSPRKKRWGMLGTNLGYLPPLTKERLIKKGEGGEEKEGSGKL